MINKLQLRILFGIAIAIWAAMLYISGEPVYVAILKPANHVLLAITLLLTTYEKWLWRWPLIKLIVKRPDLNGIYQGTIVSEWIDPATGKKLPPIPAFISIRQTLLSMQIRQYTVESGSSSVVADIINDHDGRYDLIYTYRNEPRSSVRDRSQIHYGSAKLLIQADNRQLNGAYWTDRNTKGEMHFGHICQGHCHSYQACEEKKQKHVTTNKKNKHSKHS